VPNSFVTRRSLWGLRLCKGQILLERPDRTGPDRTRPDEYFRVSDQVSDQVSDMSSSTSETLSLTKPETFVTWCVKTDPETRPFKQDGGRKWSYCSGLFCNYCWVQFRGCKSINKKKTKGSTPHGWKSTSVADNSMENVTLCCRNLLLLRCEMCPLYDNNSVGLVVSCRF